MHFNTKQLYKALDAHRKHLSLSWRQLGAKSLVAPCTFTRMGQGKHIGTYNAFKLVKFLGVSFQKFVVVD
jgi:hypothetical protein